MPTDAHKVIDITSKDLFQGVFDHSALGLGLASLSGTWVRVNPAFAAMLGYTQAELEGKSFADTSYGEDRLLGRTEVAALLAGTVSAVQFEKRYRHKGGQPVWVAIHGSVLRDGAGAPTLLLATVTDVTQLKRGEIALRENNEQLERRVAERTKDFATLAESIPHLIWVVDGQGEPLYFNRRWIKYTGISVLRTGDWAQIIHPEDRADATKAWAQSLASGKAYAMENRFRRATDGSYRWHLIRATPICDEHGQVIKWFGTCTDIHDQKEAMRNAKENRARIDTVIANTNIVLWGADRDGFINYSEGRGLALVGVKPGERIGSSIFELYKDQPSVLAAFRAALAGAKQQTLVSAGGCWFEAMITPTYDDKGVVTGIVGASVDVSERVRADQALKEVLLRLETVITHAPIVLWSIDRDGRFTLLQGKGLATTLPSPESLLGTSVFELYKDRPESIAIINRALAGETCDVETTQDNTTHATNLTPIRDSSGVVTGVVGLSTDITAKKKLQEEQSQLWLEREAGATLKKSEAQLKEINRALTEATEAKSQFLANMSHEIRTPINGVVGMTGLLLDTPLTSEQRDYANTIRSSADTLLTLVNDILDFSKIEAGKLDLEIIHFDLEQVVKDIAKSFSFAASKKGLRLSTDFAEDFPPPTFRGDPTRLRQILTNLLANAIKFTNAGQIRLLVSLTGESGNLKELRFAISDTGIGIPVAAQSRMFQTFSQADASMSRRFGGTGLGLSICKHLVKLLGGDIGVISREGQGSTFWFTAQMEASSAAVGAAVLADAAAAELAKPDSPRPGKKVRILLAEDNTVNQLIAIKMLEKCGYYVDVVGNGNEAIDALRSAPYDLVLMDCQMPEMDGYEATRIIRRSLTMSFHAMPIVAMTANAMAGDREKCLAAGMTDYVAKPVKIKDLQAVIEKALAGKLSTAS